MKWKKLGKIFDPTDYTLPNNCVEFAQSPQTLVFDNFIRIYFSTRERDTSGKFLSHIAFVDFDKQFKKILKVSNNTVIKLGNLGCFDEHGIFPLNILKTENKLFGYIGGWSRRVSVSVDGSIGIALSNDEGLTFKRIGDGPILTASFDEPFMVGDPFVFLCRDVYHMWYIYGVKWIKRSKNDIAERVYKIGHARSNDGIYWCKDGNNKQLISDKLNVNECQALPTVVEFNGRFHMFFCYRNVFDFRNVKNKGYRIGYAYSKNLIDWKRDDKNVGIGVSTNGWDSDMLCYPHVFRLDDKIYMLYNGNEFGKFGFGLAILEDKNNEY